MTLRMCKQKTPWSVLKQHFAIKPTGIGSLQYPVKPDSIGWGSFNFPTRTKNKPLTKCHLHNRWEKEKQKSTNRVFMWINVLIQISMDHYFRMTKQDCNVLKKTASKNQA